MFNRLFLQKNLLLLLCICCVGFLPASLYNLFSAQKSKPIIITKTLPCPKKLAEKIPVVPFTFPNTSRHWGIITPKHTIFLAQLISRELLRHGIQTSYFISEQFDFPLEKYIVLCANVFSSIPPADKLIVYQLEQSVSSRWFTQTYIDTLKSAKWILDYSLTNIEFLKHTLGPDHSRSVVYLPIGAITEYEPHIAAEKTWDILFYGDYKSCERRRKMLDAAKEKFQIEIVTEVFGQKMHEMIKKAKIVLNIHYYENALLELPRIQESLSLGTPVVSESSVDQNSYPELQNAVIFFETGSIEGMLKALNDTLHNLHVFSDLEVSVGQSSEKFAFMMDRFLIGSGVIPYNEIKNSVLFLPDIEMQVLNGLLPKAVLSMPESLRRDSFYKDPFGKRFALYDGFFMSPGWKGCAMSYMKLAQYALESKLPELLIVEDDVELPSNFDVSFDRIWNAIKDESSWDIFSGLISDAHPETSILDVKVVDGMVFVLLDKLTSTVFNIYREKALNYMSEWDFYNEDVMKNTIDRVLEGHSLKTMVKLPYFVGHKDDQKSTLWGFQNTQYNNMIARSQSLLLNKTLAKIESSSSAYSTSDREVVAKLQKLHLFVPDSNK
jgi:Glycosyltransferase family 25 (LPS biosynthesis protein)